MTNREVFSLIEREISVLFSSRGISEREDSRAFGAMVEKNITDNWVEICKKLKFDPIEIPGRRTIFDFACVVGNVICGFDVKTKDLDAAKYSDGGVCAVGNLLKFLANDRGIFIIVEIGHILSTSKGNRNIKYIRVAPFHILPKTAYRIENLGTGQVRLNNSLNEIWDEIDWDRSIMDFYKIFCDLATSHYKRVKLDSEKRIKSVEEFIKNDYRNFKFIR